MPYEITDRGGYMHVKMRGAITGIELERFSADVDRIEDAMEVSVDRVTDITAIEAFGIGFPEILTLAEHRRKRVFTRPVKSALIALLPEQIGFARMFQTLNDNPQIELRIVGSLHDAEEWFAAKAPADEPRP